MKSWEGESASELAHWVCGHAEEPELAGVEAGPRQKAAEHPLIICCPSANPKNLTTPRNYPKHLPIPRDKLAHTA